MLWSGAAAKAKVQGSLGSGATENAQPQAGASARRPFRLKVGTKMAWACGHASKRALTQQAENGRPRVLMQCSGFFNMYIYIYTQLHTRIHIETEREREGKETKKTERIKIAPWLLCLVHDPIMPSSCQADELLQGLQGRKKTLPFCTIQTGLYNTIHSIWILNAMSIVSHL